MKIKIDAEDRQKLQKIIAKYSTLHDELNVCESKLNSIENERSFLHEKIKNILKELEDNRKIEQSIVSELTERYGEFSIDESFLDIYQ